MLEDVVERLCCTSLPSRTHALYKINSVWNPENMWWSQYCSITETMSKIVGTEGENCLKIWGQAKQVFLSKKLTQRNLTESSFKITFKKDE